MSSRDISELPQEHIFTLVLFFRDQTGGNRVLLCSSSQRLHQPATAFPHRVAPRSVLCSSFLPWLLQGRHGNVKTWANKLHSPSCLSFIGFLLICFFFFPFFLIAKPSSCSLLSCVSFKNHFSQVLLPPQCALFIVPFLCCFSMGDPTSYLKCHMGCIVPPLLDTCEKLSFALLFFSPSERLQRKKCLLCSFDFRGETGATFYELLSSEKLASRSLCPVLIPVEHYSAGWISFPYWIRKQQAELSKTVFK